MKASDRGRNVKSKELFGCFDETFISKSTNDTVDWSVWEELVVGKDLSVSVSQQTPERRQTTSALCTHAWRHMVNTLHTQI